MAGKKENNLKEEEKKPKKKLPIRLGAFIPISIIVVGVILFNLLFLDSLLKGAFTGYAEKKNKAKVDIGLFDLGLTALSISIKDMAWADASKPMFNLFSFDEMGMDMRGPSLLYKKIHLTDVKLTGLKFNGPRETSGALSSGKKEKGLGNELKESQENKQKSVTEDKKEKKKPAVDFDGISDRVANSIKGESKSLDSEIQSEVAGWKKQAQAIGNINGLKQEIEPIKKINLSQYKNVKNVPKLKQDLDKIKNASNSLKNKKKQIQETKNKISSAANGLKSKVQDVKDLRDKNLKKELLNIVTDQGNIENATELIFGPDLAQKLGTYFDYYEKYSSYIPKRSKSSAKEEVKKKSPFRGTVVDFTGEKKAPSFLLANLQLSGEVSPTLPIAGTIKAISSDLTWRPVKINIQGTNSSTPFSLTGSLFKIKETGMSDHKLKLNARNIDLRNMGLFKGNALIKGLNRGKADIYSTLTDNGKEVKINATIIGKKWSLEVKELDNKVLSSILKRTLKNLPNIKVQAVLAVERKDNKFGRDVKLNLKSDLDKTLNRSLRNFFSGETKKQKDKLTSMVMSKSDKFLGPLTNKLGGGEVKGLDKSLDEINSMDKALKNQENAINKKIKDLENQAKKQVEKKAQDAVKSLKKKLPF